MKKLVDIKHRLAATLEPIALKHGFKLKKREVALEYSTEEYTCRISFLYNSWNDEKHVFPYAEVCYKQVHELCYSVGFHLNYTAFINLFVLEKIHKGEWTEDTSWQLQQEERDRFIVTEDCNMEAMQHKLADLIEHGMTFFCNCDSMQKIDKMFNTNPANNYNPYCSGLDTHCFIGLIAAYLSGNPKYSRLCKEYKQIVESEDFYEDTKRSFFALLQEMKQG